VLASIVLIDIAWLLFPRHEVTDCRMAAFTQLSFTESEVLNNIREENIICSGGSGKVYHIHLTANHGCHNESGTSAGRMVVVKRIWSTRKLDAKLDKEFNSEVKVLSNIWHNNIMKLLCCISS
jgi:kinase